MRAKPSIDEPSNPMPSSSAPSNSSIEMAKTLQHPENIGKPQTDKPYIILFSHLENIFFALCFLVFLRHGSVTSLILLFIIALDGVITGITCSDADGIFYRYDKYFTISDISGFAP